MKDESLRKRFEKLERTLYKHLSPYIVYYIVALDLIINLWILLNVNYTEIDWKAYMQEVEGVEKGSFNYTELRGDTGPLVYPGGFVIIFYILKKLTNDGKDIWFAQIIFALLHTGVVLIVSQLFKSIEVRDKRKLPLIIYILLTMSRRIHSIFALRLFNDCVAIFLAYCAFVLTLKQIHTSGVLLFSFACSVKMNIILFLPGLVLILARECGFVKSLFHAFCFLAVQIFVGLPFLLSDASAYIGRAIDVNRVFDYTWTVNYKFLSEEMFASKQLALMLTCCTLLTWTLVGHFIWAKADGGLHRVILNKFSTGRIMPAIEKVEILFFSNFIGIVFFRSLHYQFYCWYFHQLGFLLWVSDIPLLLKPVLLLGIEASFNIFPATPYSSLVLQLCHASILLGMIRSNFHIKTKAE